MFFWYCFHFPTGEKFLEMHKECAGHCTPVVAHQLCALQIFQARVTRSRYEDNGYSFSFLFIGFSAGGLG